MSSPIRPYGDTTGDGMVQLSFTLPMPHSKVADGAALQLANKMGMDPALVVHGKPMGPDFTFFVVYGRVNHLVDPSTVTDRRARLPAAHAQGGQRRHQAVAAPPAGRRGRLHRHRRPHRRHRRDPQHQGLRGGEGPGVLPRGQGREPRRPGLGAAARRAVADRARPTPSWSPRSSPSATPTCSTPARCRPRSARPTPPDSGRCSWSAGPASTRRWPATSASTGSSAAAPRPARSPRFIVHRVTDAPTRKAS